jgi:hypothetical protein
MMVENIHNTLTGVFDDCQDIVKPWPNDLALQAAIGTDQLASGAPDGAGGVLLPGICKPPQRSAAAFHGAIATSQWRGHVARMMGLPIDNRWSLPNETTC